jgi:hypothetical protein
MADMVAGVCMGDVVYLIDAVQHREADHDRCH